MFVLVLPSKMVGINKDELPSGKTIEDILTEMVDTLWLTHETERLKKKKQEQEKKKEASRKKGEAIPAECMYTHFLAAARKL